MTDIGAKLLATGDAVCVKVPKEIVINKGWCCFERAWAIAGEQMKNNYEGQVVREITFFDAGDAVEVTFHLAKVTT